MSGSGSVRRQYHFPPDRPSLRGVIHQRSVWVFLAAFVALEVVSPDWAARGWVAAHAVGILTMLGVSGVYHTADVTPQTRHLLRRLDHSAILLAIAGSYTGIAGLALEGTHRTVWILIVWVAAASAILLRLFVFDGLHPLIAASYLVVSWAALIDAPTLAAHLGGGEMALLLAGGAMYTGGALVLGLRRPNPWPRVFGFHEIFHSLVVAAAACHVAVSALLIARRT